MYFYSLWEYLSDIVKVFGLMIYFIQIGSYTYTVFINPGIPKRSMSIYHVQQNLNVKNFRICNICNIIMNMDENTAHCDDCNICIEGMYKITIII